MEEEAQTGGAANLTLAEFVIYCKNQHHYLLRGPEGLVHSDNAIVKLVAFAHGH